MTLHLNENAIRSFIFHLQEFDKLPTTVAAPPETAPLGPEQQEKCQG
jgi:hypothetical protein